ncbi:MAG: MlaD family protein [Pseudomonadota bacterium]
MVTDFSSREKIVGLFGILIAILLLATTIVIGRGKDWFRPSMTFYASFTEGYNLEVNTPVKLYNTDIGKVKQIELVGEKVTVELRIFKEFADRMREGSVATVESPTLIGSEFVSIKPGPLDAPPLMDGALILTKAKKSLSDIMAEFEVEKTAKMVVEAIQGIAETAQQLRRPEGPLMTSLAHIEGATRHLEMITGELQAGSGTAGSLLKSRELLEAVLAKVDRLGDILDELMVAARKVPPTMDMVQENLVTIKGVGLKTSDGLDRLNRILVEIDITVGHLRNTLKNVETGSYDIPDIMRTTEEGIQELREGLESADQIMESIKQNPLIRSNLPEQPAPSATDAGIRP